jgi:hypothetical protein
MDSIISTKRDVAGFEGRKTIPCVTIDLQIPRSAPSDEFIIIEYYPHDPFPALALEVIAMFGLLEPVIVRPGKVSGIFKHGEESSVVLAPIPVQENHANA